MQKTKITEVGKKTTLLELMYTELRLIYHFTVLLKAQQLPQYMVDGEEAEREPEPQHHEPQPVHHEPPPQPPQPQPPQPQPPQPQPQQEHYPDPPAVHPKIPEEIPFPVRTTQVVYTYETLIKADEDQIIPGLGDYGDPVKVVPYTTEEEIEKCMKKEAFNKILSDKISFTRKVPDARHPL